MATGSFPAALAAVLKHEGGFVNHPADPGGATNLGVTLATARRLGIDVDGDGDTDIVDIKKLTKADAAKVYRAEYWDAIRGDDLPQGIDYCAFDAAVHSGPKQAAKWLQEALGVAKDGVIGPQTLAAARALNARATIKEMCDLRMAFLRRLKTWPTFGTGWSRRVDDVEVLALAMSMQKATDPVSLPPQGQPDDPGVEPVPAKRGWLAALIELILKLFRR